MIELLVVISIIALLIGILLPALAAARATARSSTCSSSLRQMGVADAAYQAEHDGDHVPMVAGRLSKNVRLDNVGNDISWFRNPDFIRNIPNGQDSTTGTLSGGGFSGFDWDPAFLCPEAVWAKEGEAADERDDQVTFAYSMFGDTITYGGRAVQGTPGIARSGDPGSDFNAIDGNITMDGAGARSFAIINPSEKFFFGDGLDRHGAILWDTASLARYEANSTNVLPGNIGTSYIGYRHPNQSANVLFFDGHVANLVEDDIYESGFDNARTRFNSDVFQKHWNISNAKAP